MKYPYPHHSSTYHRSSSGGGNAEDNLKYFQDKALNANDEMLATAIGIAVGAVATIAAAWVCHHLFTRKTK
jgi:hypothetical protein